MRQLLQTDGRSWIMGERGNEWHEEWIAAGLTCVQTFGHCRGIDQIAFAYLATDVRIEGLEFDLPLHCVNHEEGVR